MMDIENITALSNKLEALGFDHLGYLLLKKISFRLQNFWLLHKPDAKLDHGTHISGLIAGGMGIGVHPGASVQSLTLQDGAGATVFDANLEQLVVNALDEAKKTVRVANFSINLNAQDRAMSDLLAQQLTVYRTVLIVAAAGDTPGTLSNQCNVLPACLSLDESRNLLVVGGAQMIDGSWSLWPLSASGARVHLLVPAIGALSAVNYNGWLGAMTGTSQSAAIASGLAARLFERSGPPGSGWSPLQVRNRLMATSRITAATLVASQSGVVDGDRALETETQVLRRKTDAGAQELRGRLQGIVDAQGELTKSSAMRFVLTDGTGADFDFCRMYRLSRLGGQNEWVFAYEPPGIDDLGRWSTFKIYPIGTLGTFSKFLRFQETGAPMTVDVPMSDVLDFYDEFSGRLACQSQS